MQTTGIVRRIDELGRIVIPKELRRSMRLHEGDELEIAMDGDLMTMKKYSEMEAMRHILEDIAVSLKEFTEADVFVCDGNFVNITRAVKNAQPREKRYPTIVLKS